MNGVGRRRTQILNDLRKRRRYWELNEGAEDRKRWKPVHESNINISDKSMNLLISSAPNNNNNNNNNNNKQGPDFDDMSYFSPWELDDAIQYVNLGYGAQAPKILIL